MWKVNVSLSQLIKPGEILCWASKWVGEKKVHTRYKNDKDMLTFLHKQLSEADAVIHYNGTKFDIPWIQGQFLLAGLPPAAPFKQIDLLRTVRSQFRFPSNKLDYVSQALGMTGKTSGMDMSIWVGCMADNPKSWKKMLKYNRQDVRLTEELYFKILPWIKGHPDSSLYNQYDGRDEGMACPKCDSKDIIARGNFKTQAAVFKRYSCKSCNSWFRGKINISLQNKHDKTASV